MKHKLFFFACSWAHYETAAPGSFRLIPPKTRMEDLRKDYLQMNAMIFGQPPEWDEIIMGLTELERSINSQSVADSTMPRKQGKS